MTRLSSYLLPTEKQAPADAEALSHKLLVRAGLIRQVGTGLWSWLPAGWRVHEKAAQIVREEMNAIGSQELLMPVLNPAELWQRSGPLRHRRGLQAQGPPRRRHGAGADARGGRDLPRRDIVRSYRELPLQPLPLPDQGARRGAPARRACCARASSS